MARRIDDLSENIEALMERISKCSAFNIALDESTDLSDTAQLAVFIRVVTDNFEVIEEFLDIASIKSTTTGQNIFEEVMKLMKKFEADYSDLVGITTDGARSMVGENNRFFKRFLDVVQSEDVLASHSIIHQ